MAIITQEFAKVGQMHGMPVIREAGLATDDTDLTTYETGRVELVPVPRAAGIVVKVLDGRTDPTLFSIASDPIVGTVGNLLQLGNTMVQRAFPKQPFGTYTGKEITAYQRTWVQIEE